MLSLSRTTGWRLALVMAGALMFLSDPDRVVAADSPASSPDKERKLITLIQSEVPPQDKALAFKQLAVCGTKDAVPALASFLANEELASWARIALEAIPDPAASEALRSAMDRLQGRLLVGVINSIGVRRDAQAVAGLAGRLKDPDAQVAAAAAIALGRIGNEAAVRALEPRLADAPAELRSAVAQGCVLCAEQQLAQGQRAEAIRLYDAVRKASVPQQRILEATRGAILARQADGLPLLLEQLKAQDKALFEVGLRSARELPGRAVSEAVAAELRRAPPDRQPWLLLALADRSDDAVLPAVRDAAAAGPSGLRVTALGALERLGNVSCIPVLLEAAADAEAAVARAAMSTLVRLSGDGVDADLAARLGSATGKQRQVLIGLAGQRHIPSMLPAIVPSLEAADAGVRSAAVAAVAALGETKQVGDLARLIPQAASGSQRAELEQALITVSSRSGAAAVPALIPLARHSDAGVRTIALGALAAAGGPEALTLVKAAVDDKDEAVQDEAVRTLSTWPNNWPEDAAVAAPLLGLAKSGKKTSHQVLGFRGYLEYVKGDKNLKDEDKLAKIQELSPLMKYPEEKRAAVAAVGTIATPGAVQMLTTLAADSAITEEAYAALVPLAAKGMPGLSKDQRRQALQEVIEKSKADATKKKAEEALKRL